MLPLALRPSFKRPAAGASFNLLPSLLLVCLPAVTFQGARADEPVLPATVVTPSRSAQAADDTLASVSVLTRADLERLQAPTLEAALANLPGVALANNGGVGKLSTLFIRGTESDHVLVLIDGVKISAATSGLAALQDLPIEWIERIELVRGPRASLYGSEAIGGVLQIITRRSTDAPAVRASVGAGTHHSASANVGFHTGNADRWLDADVLHRETRGYDSCRGIPNVAGCFTREPDRDGYRQDGLQLNTGLRLNQTLRLEGRLYDTQAHSDFDGDFVNQTRTAQRIAALSLVADPQSAWGLRADLARFKDQSDNLKDGAFQSRFDTARDTVGLQAQWRARPGQRLTLGLDGARDEVDSDTAFDATSRNERGLYAQYQGQLNPRQTVQVSGRHDHNSQFGNYDTGALAWQWAFAPSLSLRASHGTAFKAPSFNDLYYPGFGNPDLRPETSRSTELALSGSHTLAAARLNWTLETYHTRVHDLIGFDPLAFVPVNIARARLRGVELNGSAQHAGWRVGGGINWLDARDEASGNQLPRRPRQVLHVDLDHQNGLWQWGASLLAAARRYDDADNTLPLPGYGVLDLRASRQLGRDWQVQARLGNVFDKAYETAAYYPQAGRELFFTLRYAPRS